MAQYRKKPVVVDAFRWTADADQTEDPDWIREATLRGAVTIFPAHGNFATAGMTIKTLEGTMRAVPGDWIIKGVAGELYPCKPEIFEASYESADLPTGVPPGERLGSVVTYTVRDKAGMSRGMGLREEVMERIVASMEADFTGGSVERVTFTGFRQVEVVRIFAPERPADA